MLIYLSLKFNGDYRRMRKAILEKDFPSEAPLIPEFPFKTLTIVDENFPEDLRNHCDCPLVLYYYGDISLISDIKKNLAVVGTRDPTFYGIQSTIELVDAVAKQVNIVSGLARGIDSIAQEEALRVGGKVIAILGSGIDHCYPYSNRALYEEIKKKGLVISEYPGFTEPTSDKFPLRNRIIAMLSSTILITEAYGRSGTSITTTYALDMGKNVCCVPFLRNRGSLCNSLIAAGAFPVENGSDVLEIMKIDLPDEIFDL